MGTVPTVNQIRVIFATEPEIEYTVDADFWEIKNGVLFTWESGVSGRHNQQAFVLEHVLRWAIL